MSHNIFSSKEVIKLLRVEFQVVILKHTMFTKLITKPSDFLIVLNIHGHMCQTTLLDEVLLDDETDSISVTTDNS